MDDRFPRHGEGWASLVLRRKYGHVTRITTYNTFRRLHSAVAFPLMPVRAQYA